MKPSNYQILLHCALQSVNMNRSIFVATTANSSPQILLPWLLAMSCLEMVMGVEYVRTRVLNVKEKKKEDDGDGEVTGCWIKFRLFGRCISSRAKVESSVSGSSTQYGNHLSSN
ncbi:hypothetical protein QVD17_31300 [Tagetes erecta]|uniref:Uncharacterized protein n=1 Tax=Tagetes erecta TaxID=13708 RepID=A0AAD8NNR3_TARER|nr:hypothetical protein QVD17_31300 [Tagetes erecta]